MGPLLPYIRVPELPLTPIAALLSKLPVVGQYFDPRHPPTIKPFGVLVALAVYVGTVVAMRHAKARGLSREKTTSFIFWVVGAGFVGGHVLDAIFYHPDRLLKNPLYLLMLWDGLSSYGGFVGAICGALLFRWLRGERIMPYVEVVTSAFPLAWVFGRTGCAVVHDHPGKPSDSWLAVKWPFPTGGYSGRYDLGLVEMLLAIPLAVGFLVLWRRKPVRPPGFYSGWMCIYYAPVRFFLDFLREEEESRGGDPRYGGLTPAQWACFGLLALGLFLVRHSMRSKWEVEPGAGGSGEKVGPAGGESVEGDGESEKGAEVASGEGEPAKGGGETAR